MTEETATIQRLDYSKPPPGYTVRFEDSSGANGDGPPLWWYGAPHCLASMGSEAEALAAAWAHYKAHNDPPGMWSGQARGEHPGGYGYALMESSHEHPLEADFERIDDARAAAWAWYDRRLALTSRLDTAPGFRVDHCGDCDWLRRTQETAAQRLEQARAAAMTPDPELRAAIHDRLFGKEGES